MSNPNNSVQCKTLAVVSGKGGSGKTMIAATMATVLDSLGYKVLLVDSDFGTAGLTYYMGLNTVANISIGLTNLASSKEINQISANKYSQKMKGFNSSSFISVGDHRRYLKSSSKIDIEKLFLNLIDAIKHEYDFMLIDCRGGIDSESLMVCKTVDKIVIVAETDTTSFQATQHLVDTLYDYDLSDRLAGFLINKVFDDPSTISRAGTSSFKSQYLDSIPFDLEATKSFLVGDLPSKTSLFHSQVWHVLSKLFPESVDRPYAKSLHFTDYRGLSLRDNDSLLGGMFLSFMSLIVGSLVLSQYFVYERFYMDPYSISIMLLVLLSVISGIEPSRRVIGRVFNLYRKYVTKIFIGS